MGSTPLTCEGMLFKAPFTHFAELARKKVAQTVCNPDRSTLTINMAPGLYHPTNKVAQPLMIFTCNETFPNMMIYYNEELDHIPVPALVCSATFERRIANIWGELTPVPSGLNTAKHQLLGKTTADLDAHGIDPDVLPETEVHIFVADMEHHCHVFGEFNFAAYERYSHLMQAIADAYHAGSARLLSDTHEKNDFADVLRWDDEEDELETVNGDEENDPRVSISPGESMAICVPDENDHQSTVSCSSGLASEDLMPFLKGESTLR